ncbi:MAG: hypothetical protein NZZ41_04640 [Candidatus Dojkabacteria bacterium]|nr:hypothetical protein [Candidatus Dojkabacteria bacterium]
MQEKILWFGKDSKTQQVPFLIAFEAYKRKAKELNLLDETIENEQKIALIRPPNYIERYKLILAIREALYNSFQTVYFLYFDDKQNQKCFSAIHHENYNIYGFPYISGCDSYFAINS